MEEEADWEVEKIKKPDLTFAKTQRSKLNITKVEFIKIKI